MVDEGTIFEGKNVEQAIEHAVKQFKANEDELEIEIIQQPVKGIFGLAKMAKIKAKRKSTLEETEDNFIEVGNRLYPEKATYEKTDLKNTEYEEKSLTPETVRARDVLSDIIFHMGMSRPKIKVRPQEENIYLDIQSEAEGLLIGRHGQTLSSLQYLVNRIVRNDEKVHFVVDVGGYRVRHQMILEKMAKRIAKKVAQTNCEQELKAMSAFDRRIIHLCMLDNPEVTTYSMGEGNMRRIVIAPKNKAGKEEIKTQEEEPEEKSKED